MTTTYERRRALGVCAQCGGERDDHRLLCAACRVSYAKRNRKSYIKRTAWVPPERYPTLTQKVRRLQEIQRERQKLDKETNDLLTYMLHEMVQR